MHTKILHLLSLVWLLALAILVTIYLAWAIYPLEISWLQLDQQLVMTSQTLQDNFKVLMHYLTLPWVGTLAMPDFPSSASGLKHFVDVKHLFHLVQGIVLLLALPSFIHLWKNSRSGALWLYEKSYLWMTILPLVIGGVGLLLGFETFFTLFHNLLFPGDNSWLFDPRTDPVIWALPEAFFLHCFIIFFSIYEFLAVGLYLLAKKQWQSRQNRK